ncbi:hypothetical protein HDV02_004926 [Globomyces sp. JEL0801]|nr:hypothetical protein HDV02_004926 [Globomyces sp. JEL0801]
MIPSCNQLYNNEVANNNTFDENWIYGTIDLKDSNLDQNIICKFRSSLLNHFELLTAEFGWIRFGNLFLQDLKDRILAINLFSFITHGYIFFQPTTFSFQYERFSYPHLSSERPLIVYLAPEGIEGVIHEKHNSHSIPKKVWVSVNNDSKQLLYPTNLLFIPKYHNCITKSGINNHIDRKDSFMSPLWNRVDENSLIPDLSSNPEDDVLKGKEKDSAASPSNSTTVGVTTAQTPQPIPEPEIPKANQSPTTMLPPVLNQPKFSSLIETDLTPTQGFTKINNIKLSLDEMDDDDFDDFFETAKPTSASVVETPLPTPSIVNNNTSPPNLNTPFSPNYNDVNSWTPGPDPNTPFSPEMINGHFSATSPPNMNSPFQSPSSPYYKSINTPNAIGTPNIPAPFTYTTPIPIAETPYPQPLIEPFMLKAELQSLKTPPEYVMISEHPCPKHWLPYNINLEVVFGNSHYGNSGKWNYQPSNQSFKKPKINLSKFLKRSKVKRFANKQKNSDRKHSVSINANEFIVVKKYHVNKKIHFGNCSRRMETFGFEQFHMWVDQIYNLNIEHQLLDALMPIHKHPLNHQQKQIFTDIIKRLFTADCIDLNLEEFYNLEEKESDHYFIGTMKLRKKKVDPSTYIETLEPKLIFSHNNMKLSGNTLVEQFWEISRIAPVSGLKDVWWIALYPILNDIDDDRSIQFYMDQISALWKLLSFGRWQPCPIDDRLYGLISTPIKENSYEELLIGYETKIPEIANTIVQQFFSEDSLIIPKHCIVSIWNPYVGKPNSTLDICNLFTKLIDTIQRQTNYTKRLIQSKVLLKIITDETIDSIFIESNVIQFKKLLFSIYNQIPKILDHDTLVYAPAYTIENIQDEPKYSVEVPQRDSKVLLMEPDRLIHVEFGKVEYFTLLVWKDKFGEWKHEEWIDYVVSIDDLIDHIFKITLRLFGMNGFQIRLIINNVDGWDQHQLTAWRERIQATTDLMMKPDIEDTLQQPDPNVMTSPIIEKQYPTTPGSGYTTPQPALLHNKPKKQKQCRSTCLSSVTLVSLEDSFMIVDAPTTKNKISNSWYEAGHLTELFSIDNPQLCQFGKLKPLSVSWILNQTPQTNQTIQGMVLFHCQVTTTTTCYPNWQDLDTWSFNYNQIIKDILHSYNSLRLTNLNRHWLFEEIAIKLKLLSLGIQHTKVVM